MPRIHRALVVAAFLALGAGALEAQAPRDAALGFSGEIYVAKSGQCRDLFTNCAPGAGSHPLIAIDIQVPGEPLRRLQVPETEGPAVEGQPSLVFEDASNSLFVFWESRPQPQHSRVNLAWLKAGTWSQVFEVSGDIAPLKGPPQVSITRDFFEVVAAEGQPPVRHSRTVLHVAWWEKAAGSEEVYYTPIFLIDGAYLGRNEVYNLSDLDPNPLPQQATALSADLLRSPKIETGRDENSVVMGFVNKASERFLVFDARVLPAELGVLADGTAGRISDDEDLFSADGLVSLAEHARGHMIEMGHRLHPGLLTFLADDVATDILDNGLETGSIVSLAEHARGHMIEMGARVFGEGGMEGEATATVSRVLEIRAPAPEGQEGAPHHVWLRLVNDRRAPGVGAGPTWMFLAEDGLRAVVSWGEPGALRYRETRDGAWTAARRIALEGPIDAARAEQILRQRVRER